MSSVYDDFDSPWKTILEACFQEFLAFFFPHISADIDWDKGYTFLDKELAQVVRDAELGKRLADKLVQVWRRNGDEAWVLIHIEVQGYEEAGFSKRMYVYNYRVFDRYDRSVVSLAVLADERENWRPDHFSLRLWGCETGITFPAVKILDYQDRWAEMEASANPFAFAVMAHLKTKETSHDPEDRKRWKLYLIRRLYDKGYSREDVIRLFHFIDWLMRLPAELEQRLGDEIREIEEEKKMRYVSNIERFGIEKGLQQGVQQSVLDNLDVRFESVPGGVKEKIEKIHNLKVLKILLRKSILAESPEQFIQMMDEYTDGD